MQIDEQSMTTLAAFPKGRDEKKKKKKKKINKLKDLSFTSASSPNGNTFTDRELQVEIFFLIIGHP